MVLDGARAVVTAGAGFIGSYIVNELVGAGCREITVVDNFVRGRRDLLARLPMGAPVKLVEADVGDCDRLDDIIRDSDVVFHQAATQSTDCAIHARHASDVMVRATFDLIRICAAHHVQRLVVASSAAVDGMAERLARPEAVPSPASRTPHGGAQPLPRGLLSASNEMSALNYVVLSYGTVYGPRMDIREAHSGMLVRWMELIGSGLSPVIFGDGQDMIDLVHVYDVARASILAATAPVGDVALNIGSGGKISLYDLAVRLARAMGRDDLMLEFRPRRAANPVARQSADIAAARETLDYRPVVALDEGLCQLVAWWRAEQGEQAGFATAGIGMRRDGTGR
jgi:UDP-glucose 4-epimerase